MSRLSVRGGISPTQAERQSEPAQNGRNYCSGSLGSQAMGIRWLGSAAPIAPEGGPTAQQNDLQSARRSLHRPWATR